ncbi:MAG TPA: maltose ABC transporter substrate-binding protein [Firmicutes bacterium]|nr:maltose ABC transporter substrate-binding protein [Bacillota bacterium]
MKKYLAFMLVAGMSLTGLVACGGNDTTDDSDKNSSEDNTTTDNSTDSNEKVEIKLWLDSDAYAEALIPAIEEALPNVSIVWENVGSADSRSKLELDGPAGVGADIILQPHDNMATSMEGKLLLPLDADLAAKIDDRMLAGSADTARFDGTYYGIPLSTESMALFYNKTLLEANDFEVATSFEMIKEQAAIYNDPTQNKYLMRFQPGDAYHMHYFLTAFGFNLFGEDHTDPDNININTPAVVDGLEYFKSMKEFLNVPYADLNWDTVHGEFVKGNVPYIIGGPWEIEEINNGAADNNFEWGITTVPTINGVQPKTFSGNIIASVSAYSKHPTEAKQVLDFMTSNEGLQILFDTTGKIPALKDNSVINGVLENPYVAGILEQAAYAEAMPTLVEMAKYWTPAETMFRSVWDDLATPEQAASKALDDYNMSLEMTE